ncbi:type I-E CRISPR-associated protein Cas7/Cse4/CasC [Tepidimonas taiwanensis]|uniref:type I-E CRISPR-associated protein Cas7/Cse4/CasC n=1 Tax=Tepidimonas taiwanensis TaxID=307486 RepID=UPI000734EDF2|nr:type I-E CRISPR-associated protein Cas7/Cse4/CasC [Tepidimonas taiwanensis]
MFLQIHTLTSYPASLLNRDDAGLAKRIPFGNAIRLRVSSQCLKRHWREDVTQKLPEVPDGLRTRSFFTRTVLPKALAAGVPEIIALALIEPLAKAVIDGGVKEGGDLNQPILFGEREADYFVRLMLEASRENNALKALTDRLKSKEEKDNLKAMSKAAAGLTAALFGRMVTSDMLARVDAPVHVAHAFTVHAAHTEMDYFTVVDDLNRDDETGAAHANQTELGAGVYYGYVAVDVPLLVANLTGCEARDWRNQDPSLPRRVLEALIDSIARQSPGAKKGSTAPYAWADLLFLEVGKAQPRTLANAFLEAVSTKDAKQDMRLLATQRMADYLRRLDEMYGPFSGYRGLSTVLEPLPAALPPHAPLATNAACALDAVWNTQS